MARKSNRGQKKRETRRSYLLDESRPPLAPWREKIHDVIFEADTWAGLVFDLVLLVAILGSVVVSCLETV